MIPGSKFMNNRPALMQRFLRKVRHSKICVALLLFSLAVSTAGCGATRYSERPDWADVDSAISPSDKLWKGRDPKRDHLVVGAVTAHPTEATVDATCRIAAVEQLAEAIARTSIEGTTPPSNEVMTASAKRLDRSKLPNLTKIAVWSETVGNAPTAVTNSAGVFHASRQDTLPAIKDAADKCSGEWNQTISAMAQVSAAEPTELETYKLALLRQEHDRWQAMLSDAGGKRGAELSDGTIAFQRVLQAGDLLEAKLIVVADERALELYEAASVARLADPQLLSERMTTLKSKLPCKACPQNSGFCVKCSGSKGNYVSCKTCSGDQKVFVNCSSCRGDGRAACSTCNGKGKISVLCSACRGAGGFTCTDCDGKGYKTCSSCNGRRTQRCNTCAGRGEIPYNGGTLTCTICGGDGEQACMSCQGIQWPCAGCLGKKRENCSTCRGARNVDEQCAVCTGDGRLGICVTCSGTKGHTEACGVCQGGQVWDNCTTCSGKGSCATCNGARNRLGTKATK